MYNYIFLLFALLGYSQTKTLSGKVVSTEEKPLNNANILAKPTDTNKSIKFAIANKDGQYQLTLEENTSYEISVSYLGYYEDAFFLDAERNPKFHDFVLKQKTEKIQDIVINYQYKPIEVKKDTVTIKVDAFTNGSERKMKDALKKIPGFEVDKNGNIKYQGKEVNEFMVEGKPFFGGGSKLGVENIPADALDKIEMIDNFNKVGFMKEVLGSKDLGLNVKLKEDKKQFVFGDIEAGKGNRDFYVGHVALFKYDPKNNLSFIGDINNTGKQTLTFSDIYRLSGGMSSFNYDRPNLVNLYQFTDDYSNVAAVKNQFGALSWQRNLSKKLSLDAFGLFSNIATLSNSLSQTTYFRNSGNITEDRNFNANDQKWFGILSAKLDYNVAKNSKVFYHALAQRGATDNNSVTITNSPNNNNVFDVSQNADNFSFKHFLEWNRKVNKKYTYTFLFNNYIEEDTPINNWKTQQAFLTGLIPIQNDVAYQIAQTKKAKNLFADVLLKNYYVFNMRNQVNVIFGNNYSQNKLFLNNEQILSNANINNFGSAGFNNDLTYSLNDLYTTLEYKWRWRSFETLGSTTLHMFHFEVNQFSGKTNRSIAYLFPKLNVQYNFSEYEKIVASYEMTNSFPKAAQLSERFNLNAYNSVVRGNAILGNETFHRANLRFALGNFAANYFNAFVNYSRKENTIRDVIELQPNTINRFSSPLQTVNPETSVNSSASYSRKIKRIRVTLDGAARWFNYVQSVNNIFMENQRNSQDLGINVKTSYRKWPYLKLEYKKSFNQIKGITDSSFETDNYIVDFDIEFLKNFSFETNYQVTINTNTDGSKNRFAIANAYLRYQKESSPFKFEFSAINYLNNGARIDNNFSDFYTSNQTTFVLPAIFMLGVSYKL